MPNYPKIRDIPGAKAERLRLAFRAFAASAIAGGLLYLSLWQAALFPAAFAAYLIQCVRTMPVQEELIGSGAIYRPIRK
ncbi:MAG: hypothetical protein AAGL66_10265 [Pseudomonadota bacterium]